jgi:hypothetical protein
LTSKIIPSYLPVSLLRTIGSGSNGPPGVRRTITDTSSELNPDNTALTC